MKLINLLLEAENKIDTIKKAILNRLPLTIYYADESSEVLDGERIDIYPIVMGLNKKENRVIWAYVKNGVSKKGLPNWKMFREDRIRTASIDPSLPPFVLSEIPEYEMGKAPSAMKSLISIDVYSPYWEEGKWKQGLPKKVEKQIQQKPDEPTKPEPTTQEPQVPQEPEVPVVKTEPEGPVVSPEIKGEDYSDDALKTVQQKIIDKKISRLDYDRAVDFIYRKKEIDWKEYQSTVQGGNVRPGQGTRNRFRNDAKNEFDNILKQNNIQIEDMLSEVYRKFKHLIK